MSHPGHMAEVPCSAGKYFSAFTCLHVARIRSRHQLVKCRARTAIPEHIRISRMAVLCVASVMLARR